MKYKKIKKCLNKHKDNKYGKYLNKYKKEQERINYEIRKERLMPYIKSRRKLSKMRKQNYYRTLNEAPKLSVLEEIGNAVTHGVGALLGVLGLILLILKSTTSLMLMGSIFYGVSMILMMTMSCLYHSYKWGIKVKRIWRRFDYSSIYLLIGGTFSPILLIDFYKYHPTLSIIWFCLMWAIIITGITMVAIFGPGRLKWLHFPLYFIIGWSALMLVPRWIKYNINFFWFILAGGLVYTFGMIPFVMRGKKAAHFIWHLFVLFGAITHFLGIYFCLF